MSAPSNPTLDELVLEALYRAGESDPSVTMIARAKEKWMEEIKNDIYRKLKKLKDLQVIAHGVLVKGQSRYSWPSDYTSDMVMTLLEGAHSGIAQAGGSAQITLEATEDATEGEILGKGLLITSGTGIASYSQITAYDESTKVATVTPNFKTAPSVGSGYLIVTNEHEMTQRHISQYNVHFKNYMDMPTVYFPIGDEDYGEFILNCPPDKVYGIRLVYFTNMMKIDLLSTHMSQLYQKYRNVWIEGLICKHHQEADESRFGDQYQIYNKELGLLVTHELYGKDINGLQDRVTDFY